MPKRLIAVVLSLAMFWIAKAGAETIRATTYNVEHFAEHFMAQRLTTQKFHQESEQNKEIVDKLRKEGDEDNWEVAQTILDPAVNPDVIVMQECCNQKDLESFNRKWLDGAYETVIVFPSNTGDREQHVAMMIKPGFKVLEKKDQYYLEKDTAENARGDRLFARGPSFVKIQSPGGYVFWMGTGHLKSKSGNSPAATQWRNREAKRTQEIIKEIAAAGPSDVLFLGDCNDESGFDNEFEQENGGDTIAALLGPPEDKFVLVTRPLLARGDQSFGGYWSDRFRSFIDHGVATPSMAQRVKRVSVFSEKLAPVASDHYPVTVQIEAGPPTATPTTKPANLENAMP